MSTRTARRRTLAAVFAAVLLLAAVVLFRVIGTVFFAVTVAYVLVPLVERLRARGLSRRWATVGATLAATVAALAVVLGVAYLLYARTGDIQDVIADIPADLTVEYGGFSTTITIEEALTVVESALTGVAVDAVSVLPVLALKFALFVVLIFGLLARYEEAGRAVLAPIPPDYHDVARALHDRIGDTLFAIYVIQAATAAGTAVLALPVFLAFGYEFPVTLSLLCGFLQFVPVVGPSAIILALAGFELLTGALVPAAVFAVVGLVVVGALPDIIVRPWLASGTTDLPASLYFVGFIGGLLTLGAVGIIAGPLAVALVVETADLLADEF